MTPPLPAPQPPAFLGDPPSEPPGFSQPQSTSVTAGIQLCVSGLPFSNATSAMTNFKSMYTQILLDSRQKNPDRALPEWGHLYVQPAGVKNSADFVLVSIHERVTLDPRPDLLHNLSAAIRESSTLAADWTTGSGRDRSRIVNFSMHSKADADAMQPLLRKYLKDNKISVVFSTVGEYQYVGARISLDVSKESDAVQLCETEIVINGRTLLGTRPRFVRPRYGWDLVLNGCQSVQNFQASMDHAVTTALGTNTILSSYMDLDGDVYGVVLRTWDDVQKLQNLPETPQPSGVPVFHVLSPFCPVYFFNNRSAPASPSALMAATQASSKQQTAQIQSLQHQVQMLTEQGVQVMGTVASIVQTQTKVLEGVEKSNTEMRNALAVMAARSTVSAELGYFRSEVSRLQNDINMKRLLLMVASGDDAMKNHINLQIVEAERELGERRAKLHDVEQMRLGLDNTTNAMLPAATEATANVDMENVET